MSCAVVSARLYVRVCICDAADDGGQMSSGQESKLPPGRDGHRYKRVGAALPIGRFLFFCNHCYLPVNNLQWVTSLFDLDSH